MSTPVLVALIAAATWAAIVGLLALIEWTTAPRTRVHHVHVHVCDCTPYDQETAEGLAQAEEWANRGESA